MHGPISEDSESESDNISEYSTSPLDIRSKIAKYRTLRNRFQSHDDGDFFSSFDEEESWSNKHRAYDYSDIDCRGKCGGGEELDDSDDNTPAIFLVEISELRGQGRNSLDKEGNSALHLACHGGHEEIIRELLQDEAFELLNSVNLNGETVLHKACQSKNRNIAKLILADHKFTALSARCGSEVKLTALHVAAYQGYGEVAMALISNLSSEDINAKSIGDMTALHIASRCGREEVVDVLLQSEAFTEVNAITKEGETALHLASVHGSPSIVKKLISHPRCSMLTFRTSKGLTALHQAAMYGMLGAVKVLEEEGTLMQNEHALTNENYCNSFHCACWNNREEVVTYFIEKECHYYKTKRNVDTEEMHSLINAKSKDGSTALQFACIGGAERIVALLLQTNLYNEINNLDNMGKTPLYRAIESGHIGVVEILLSNDRVTVLSTHEEEGQDDSESYYDGAIIPKTVVDDAVRCEQFEIFKFLVGHHKIHELYNKTYFQGNNILHVAAENYPLKYIEYLLTLPSVDINAKNNRGESAVHKLEHVNDKILKLLLEDSRYVGLANDIDMFGNIPPMRFAQNERLTYVECCIAHDSSIINYKRSDGKLLIMLLLELRDRPQVAMSRWGPFDSTDDNSDYLKLPRSVELVQQILTNSHFSEVNATDVNGKSLLMYAIERKVVSIVQLIVQHPNFSMNHITSTNGITVLWEASRNRYYDVLVILISHLMKRDGVLVNELASSCVDNVLKFSSMHAFQSWMMNVLALVEETPISWSTFINALRRNIHVLDVQLSGYSPIIKNVQNILLSAFDSSKQAEVLHVHLVGDGKAGKSVAAKWLIDRIHSSIAKDSKSGEIEYYHTEVNGGRTRGVETTTLRFKATATSNEDDGKEIAEKHYVMMIHDYGGQEEFLTNHANFLSVDNSVYLIVVPLLDIGHSIEKRRVRTISDMLDRYLFWCRFVFSVVRRDQAFPIIDTNGSNINAKKVSRRGIPMLTLINKFQQYCSGDEYDNHIKNATKVLERQLKNEFSITTDILADGYDFVVSHEIFHITDNACNGDVSDVIQIMHAMLNDTPVNGEHCISAILDHVVSRFDAATIPIFMNKVDWRQWLADAVLTFPFSPPLVYPYKWMQWLKDGLMTWRFTSSAFDKEKELSIEQREDVVQLLSDYCEESLVTLNKIMLLQEEVSGFKVVTNPSVLSTEILGDLLWWFHRHNDDKTNINALRLSQHSVMDKLKVVDKERKGDAILRIDYGKYELGQEVEVRHPRRREYLKERVVFYPAIIASFHSDSGSYDVMQTHDLFVNNLRILPFKQITDGTKVCGYWGPRRQLRYGIATINQSVSDSFNIRCDSGKMYYMVPRRLLRKDDDPSVIKPYQVHVLASGTITKAGFGMYALQYDDGTMEYSVFYPLLREKDRLANGTDVKVSQSDKREMDIAGKIIKANANGSYDIDIGETILTSVYRHDIRVKGIKFGRNTVIERLVLSPITMTDDINVPTENDQNQNTLDFTLIGKTVMVDVYGDYTYRQSKLIAIYPNKVCDTTHHSNVPSHRWFVCPSQPYSEGLQVYGYWKDDKALGDSGLIIKCDTDEQLSTIISSSGILYEKIPFTSISHIIMSVGTKVQSHCIRAIKTGSIEAITPYKSFNVVFDDGTKEEIEDCYDIREVLPLSTRDIVSVYGVQGTVTRAYDHCMYDFVSVDGIEEKRVHRMHIEAEGKPFQVGTRIQRITCSKDGVIVGHNHDGTYQVQYDDGLQTSVSHNAIWDTEYYCVGKYVLAKAFAEKGYKPGRLIWIDSNKMCTIRLANGAIVPDVAMAVVLPIESHLHRVGAQVLVKPLKGKCDRLATITKVHDNFTYDVTYAKGIRMKNIAAKALRSSDPFPINTEVEVIGGEVKFGIGKIKKIESDEHYVVYSEEENVPPVLAHRCKLDLRYRLANGSNNVKAVTALDYLSELKVDSFSLVDLLNKIGLGLQIYNSKLNEMESWLLGLAPDFPKGKKELRFDWWPDHEIRRYFRLPDTRACFIPGYFLRLFVNMVNNKGYELIEGYGNAVKMSNAYFELIQDEGGERYAGCEVQIILCQLPDKDQDAFIVSVAAKGPNAVQCAFRELNVLRSFIYTDSWGLTFQEFCLPLWHVSDQTRLSRVREDYLDGKQPLDEVVPYIFGISQHCEDCEVNGLASYVRSMYSILYFGGKPDLNHAKSLTKEEEQLACVQTLIQQFQYKPSSDALGNNKYLNVSFLGNSEEQNSFFDGIYLDLLFSDIFQRYSMSCYDHELRQVIIDVQSIDELVHRVSKKFANISDKQKREVLYRCVKLYFDQSNIGLSGLSVVTFESLLQSWKSNVHENMYDVMDTIQNERKCETVEYCRNLINSLHL